jgi:hypothetical protein
MNDANDRTAIRREPNEKLLAARLLLLERITAAVLVTVILALGWMVLRAYQPDWLGAARIQAEVVIILVLLSAALILVTVLALLHTR